MGRELGVQASSGSYKIEFNELGSAWKRISGPAMCITDENVAAAWSWTIPENVQTIVVPAGEGSKSIESYESVCQQLVRAGASRQSEIVAFGGGVVGDLAGFVAATFLRGVPLVQIPTTLLAMVDSSVGGKVGIDLPEGKNLIGAFYPPKRVEVCLETLGTLPERQLRNGLAEVWKYGFIEDRSMIDRIGSLAIGDVSNFADIVETCVRIKARICEADEHDRLGVRAQLNFGHTVGHALETLLHYKELLHGEAVAIGMVVEAAIGEAIGATALGTSRKIANYLESTGLPTTHPAIRRADELVKLMKRDKKSESGRIGMSLVVEFGECKLFPDVPLEAIRGALTAE